MYDETNPAPEDPTGPSMAEADRIFAEAGWTTTLKPPWLGRHCLPGHVGGRAPNGQPFVKAFSDFPQGAATEYGLDPADYPDTHHEAALWLVEHVRRLTNPLSTAATLEAPAVEQIALADEGGVPEIEGHESDGETDEAPAANEGDEPCGDGEQLRSDGREERNAFLEPDQPIDADFTESEAFDRDVALAPEGPEPHFSDLRGLFKDADPPLLEFGEEMAEAEAQADDPASQFIFGDNLDQKRTAAIGLVMRYARSITPEWDAEVHDQQLREMRNFAAGVGEGRWPFNQTMQDELNALEAVRRQINAIEAVTRDKVAFLEAAGREEIEAFVVEAGWP